MSQINFLGILLDYFALFFVLSFKYSFKTRLIYCEKDLSSSSAKALISSMISESSVILTFVLSGFIILLLFNTIYYFIALYIDTSYKVV